MRCYLHLQNMYIVMSYNVFVQYRISNPLKSDIVSRGLKYINPNRRHFATYIMSLGLAVNKHRSGLV